MRDVLLRIGIFGACLMAMTMLAVAVVCLTGLSHLIWILISFGWGLPWQAGVSIVLVAVGIYVQSCHFNPGGEEPDADD
jgi:hypothetical protein